MNPAPRRQRPLQVIWLLDCSGSMSHDGRIQALNTAVREALPHLRRVAEENPDVAVTIRAVRYATGADWCVAAPTLAADFEWRDLEAGGFSDLGHALKLLAVEFASADTVLDAPGPVLILVTDGRPTDDYEAGLSEFLATPSGRHSLRLAVGIGDDADRTVLEKFTSDDGGRPLGAAAADALARRVRALLTTRPPQVDAVPDADPMPVQAVPIPQDPGHDGANDPW